MFVKVCGVNTEILTLRRTVCMRTLSCVISAIHKFQYCKINIENGVTMFELKKTEGKARRGVFTCAHGVVQTPTTCTCAPPTRWCGRWAACTSS